MEQNERKYIGDICYIQLNSGGVLTRVSDGASIRLSAAEYKILFYFISNKNQDLSLEQIAGYLWGAGHDKDAESIKSQIARIRSKLDQIRPGLGKQCIVTNRGFNTYTMRIDPETAMAEAAGTAQPLQQAPDTLPEVPAITRAYMDDSIPVVSEDFSIVGETMSYAGSKACEDDTDGAPLFDEIIDEHLLHRTKTDHSSLEEKIKRLKGKKYMVSVSENLPPNSIAFDPVDVDLFGRMPGQKFKYPDFPDVRTIIFEVYSIYDYRSMSRFLSLRQLIAEKAEDGRFTTYYWEYPDPRYMLVILPFRKKEGGEYEVYINTAYIGHEGLRASMQPLLYQFKSWYLPSEMKLNENAYDTVNMTEEVRRKLLEDTMPQEAEWVETGLRDAPVMIIDPETLTPVLREVYYDEEARELKARMKLVPYKGYFVFRVLDDATELPCLPLTDLELGYLYRSGLHGFPKDLLLAIRHFEKDGSPNSLYQLAGIFATDEEFRDEELYLEYLKLAADRGAESAIAELAEYHCRKGDPDSVRKAQALFERIADAESTIGSFLFACCMEKGLLGSTDPETIFDSYFRAACNEFDPALARLRCRYSDLENPDLLYSGFRNSLESGKSNVDYCLGSAYFYGYGLYPRKQEGLRLLREAAERQDGQAMWSVLHILDQDPKFRDKEKALAWLKKFESLDPSVGVQLANRLLDGEGCERNEENDLLAFSLLRKAAQTGDKTAVSNLGWMYKMGRGCQTDYAKALELFEKSGRANAFFHRADMYERGLGVEADPEKAAALYETAAGKGSEKALDRLAALRRTEEA